MIDLPTGYRMVPYRFASHNAESRFRAAQQPQGRFILYELAKVARRAGVRDVPVPEQSRSKFTPEMLVRPLEKYFQQPTLGYEAEALYQASRKVSRAFFQYGNLKPAALGEKMPDANTSAGAPTFARKGDVELGELRRARRIMRGEAPPPVTTFHRGKDDEVARPVFGYPMSMTLIENMFFQPYQEQVVHHHNPYVGGRGYPQLAGDLNEVRWKSRWVMELDYSGFDGSIAPKLIQLAFDIIKESFEMSREQEKVWELVVKYFLTCPVLLPDGQMVLGKRHGVPSGSAFTQLIDSIVNAICIEYAAIRTNTVLSRYYVMGDDSVIGVRGEKPSLNAWNQTLMELGITVSATKSKLRHRDDGPYFLGHYWSQFVGTRSRTETWEKVLTPERPDPRFFKKGTQEQKDAFIERLAAYRLDNPDLWGELSEVMNFLMNRTFFHGYGFYTFIPTKAFEERARWDMAVRHMKSQPRQRYFDVIRYFLVARPAGSKELISNYRRDYLEKQVEGSP